LLPSRRRVVSARGRQAADRCRRGRRQYGRASDTDRATTQADERLATVLAASGRVGADDPMLAFEDAVREFGPDHLLIALRRSDRAGWQEQGLLEGLLQRFGLALTVFEIGG
jgi:hypothetical protein